MTVGLPKIDIVICERSGASGLAIRSHNCDHIVFSAPFKRTNSQLTAAAINKERILTLEPRTGELAVVAADTGEVLHRAQLSYAIWSNYALVAERKHFIVFGCHPMLEVYNSADLSLIQRYDEIKINGRKGVLIDQAQYFRLGEKPGLIFHSQSHEQRYHDLGDYVSDRTIRSPLVEAEDGTLGATLVDGSIRRMPSEDQTYRICQIDYTQGELRVIAQGLVQPVTPPCWDRVLSVDAHGWINYAPSGQTSLTIATGLKVHPKGQQPFIVREMTPAGAVTMRETDRAFALFMSQKAVTRIVAEGFDQASCNKALSEMTKLIEEDLGSLIWGNRLEFSFTIAGEEYDEGEYFSELVEKMLPVQAPLQRLVQAYLAAKDKSKGRCLQTYAPSVAPDHFAVVPAMGPALRALLLLEPASIRILYGISRIIDHEHDTYLPAVIADFVRRHGSTTVDRVKTVVHYMRIPENRGPQGFEGFGLFADAENFLSPSEFAKIICGEVCPTRDYNVEDHEFADFFNVYPDDAYKLEVVDAVNAIVGRRINLRYWE